MNKKIIIVSLILAIALITACTNTANIGKVTETEETIKIGAILPITGKGDYVGEDWKTGILLAQEEINSQGGINNRELEIIIEDDSTDPNKAVSAFHKLVSINKVNIILTGMTSVTGSLSPIAEENKVILFGATTTNNFAQENDYVFKDYIDIYRDCKLLGTEIKDKKVAILGINKDSTLECIKGLNDAGINVAQELYNKGETDFKTNLLKLEDYDYLILRGYETDIISIVKQATELDIKINFVCPQIKDGCNAKELKSSNMLEDALGTDFKISDASDFIEKYKERFGEEPTADIIYMYDEIKIIAETISKCKSTNVECIKQELLNSNFKGVSGIVKFNEDGISQRGVQLVEFRNGEFVDY